MESLEEDTDNDSAASCESAGEEDPEGIDADALEQILQAAGKEKLLTIRCAAHSLQLLMKDLINGIPLLSTAYNKVKDLTEEMATPKRKELFLEVQKGRKGSPLQLKRIGSTRWNTVYDCWVRAVRLEDLLLKRKGKQRLFPCCAADIEKMKTAAKLVQPVAYATDNLQRDSAGLQDVLGQLEYVTRKWKAISDPKVSKLVSSALQSLNTRIVSNFSFDALKMLRAMQGMGLNEEQQNLMQPYFAGWLVRHGFSTTLISELSTATVERQKKAHQKKDAAIFWREIGSKVVPHLTQFYMSLCRIAASEAHVERTFKVTSRLLTKQRSRMVHRHVDAMLQVACNMFKVCAADPIRKKTKKAEGPAVKRVKDELS